MNPTVAGRILDATRDMPEVYLRLVTSPDLSRNEPSESQMSGRKKLLIAFAVFDLFVVLLVLLVIPFEGWEPAASSAAELGEFSSRTEHHFAPPRGGRRPRSTVPCDAEPGRESDDAGEGRTRQVALLRPGPFG